MSLFRGQQVQRVIVQMVLTAVLAFMSLKPSHAAEPKWESLLPAVDTKQSVAGEWRKTDKSLTVNAATGGRIVLPVTPRGEYDLRISFTRKTGRHSVGAVVVQGDRQVAFEVDAWGMNLAGFQNIGGQSIRENSTRRENMRLENGRRYTITIEVRKDSLRSLLDDKEIAKVATDGSDLSLSDLWRLPQPQQLALLAWESETEFHSVEVCSVSGGPIAIARTTTAPPTSTGTPSGRPAGTPSASPTRPSTPTPPSSPTTATGKRVLIVIANGDFFYREYADPRAELERAGIRVTVAAGRKTPSRPHHGSGEGPDGGVVTPDVALSEVKARDFDAILFSGGWGSSMYQYAFEGRYNNASYNGDRATKAEANRLINEFLAQDKYVCGLCNAVSVLAWARVDGKSPLAGKRVCAPPRQAAAGIYNGRQAQPSCRWHPEQNGAIMSPPGAVGNPRTNADDVLVDGKIITGEDDPSAREMGRRIAEVLSK